MNKPVYEAKYSLGQILQIGTILLGGIGLWANGETQRAVLAEQIAETAARIDLHGSEIAGLRGRQIETEKLAVERRVEAGALRDAINRVGIAVDRLTAKIDVLNGEHP